MAMTFDRVGEHEWKLDVCGYTCPHPQMYTKKALQKMASGDVLTVLFDNPSSGESIMAMCETDGDELFERREEGGSFAWKIRKA
ncbi:MAG: sulfurtransferase TusA family protein [Burkholderiaceae bacterium]|nr:sulfurtransferase TusA family protein [Burkholderiaceae bacterium]MCZ7560633.1 sulfurtransferase TusA family protein [Burkholderiaceae bacterium]